MILSELNNLILTAVNANYLVKEAFVGDVYDINSKENKFGCFVATPMKARKTTDGTITYNYILYYVDRLTKDESNIDFVQTDAVNLLSGLIKWLEDYGVQVENEYLFTMFRHQFDDWCAGAYVEVDLMVPDQGCGENDFLNELKGEITPLLVTENGTYTPPAGGAYGPVYVNVTSGGGEVTPEWVDNEIDFKLIGYATQSWVNAQGFITSETIPTDIATQSWVQAQGYLTSVDLTGYATESWVISQGYLTSVDLDGYATESWVSSQQFATETYVSDQISGVQSWVLNKSYITAAALTGYATEAWVTNQQFATTTYVGNQISGVQEWVLSQGYITSETIPADIATQSWVQSQGYITSAALNGYATESWVLSQSYITSNALTGYATESWVLNKSYITSAALTGYATEQWVSSQQFATETYVGNQISGVKDWVLSQSYITSAALTGYATETYVGSQISGVQDWVLSQSYITSNALSGYATESWVQSQDYLTSTSSAVTSKLNASDVWTGTVSAWESLTSEQQCSYLIALIVTE